MMVNQWMEKSKNIKNMLVLQQWMLVCNMIKMMVCDFQLDPDDGELVMFHKNPQMSLSKKAFS